MVIGVLSLQGDVESHIKMLTRCGCKSAIVKLPGDINKIDGLIIPGGESLAIGKFMVWGGLDKAIIDAAHRGLPIYGTCAGLILLAKEIEGTDQSRLGLMDISVKRNAVGRQRESFETNLDILILGRDPFKGVFIRTPIITSINNNVNILGSFEDKIVFVQQDNLLASAFHPELTDDLRIHQYFICFVRERQESRIRESEIISHR